MFNNNNKCILSENSHLNNRWHLLCRWFGQGSTQSKWSSFWTVSLTVWMVQSSLCWGQGQ